METSSHRSVGHIALVLALALASLPVARAQLVPVGGIARDFTLSNTRTGDALRLSQFAGKIVVLDFFTYWCGPCQVSSPDVELNIQKYYAARGGNAHGLPVQVLAISIDQSDKAQTDAFIRNAGLELAGDDINRSAWGQFDTGLIPTFVIINGVANSARGPQWQVLYIHAGYQGAAALRQIIDSVGPAEPPLIRTQPEGRVVLAGQPATLSVVATGSPTPTYQWLKDGTPVAGATLSAFTIAAAKVADSGSYSVMVTNPVGSVTSTPAVLSVVSAFVTPAAKEIGSARTPYQVVLTSSSSWEVTKDASWLTVSVPGGSGDANVVITAEPNTTGADRVGTVNVGGSRHTVTQRSESAPLSELWGAGSDVYGQLGVNRLLTRRTAAVVATNVRSVSSRSVHTLFVTNDGNLWAMGSGNSSALGTGSDAHRNTPVLIAADVREVSTGSSHSLFLKTDGTLWGMGSNSSGQLGLSSTAIRPSPAQIASDVQAIAAGWTHSLFLRTDGTLWAMGYNYYGQLGDGTTVNRTAPVQVATGVLSIAAGSYHSLFLKADRTLWAMGQNSSGMLGDGTTTNRPTPVLIATDVLNVSGGTFHSVFIKTDGTVWAAGYNYYGQLGDGTTYNRYLPVKVSDTAQSVAAGMYHTLILKSSGALLATGSNDDGQLGNGTMIAARTPTQIAVGVRAIAAGQGHSFWIDDTGRLWAVGADGYGQLGDGVAIQQVVPLHIASGVRLAVAGSGHSLSLKTDGSLWSVGLNSLGQLGDGNTTDRAAPIRVATSVQAMAAGGSFSLFLKSDGGLWAMGYNYSGQLGDGTTSNRLSPVQVASSVRAVAAGNSHGVFLKSDGTAWAMGYNYYGQLGDGSTTNRSTPVRIASDVQAIGAGGQHTLFVKTDGTLWGAGMNSSYQLGGTTSANRLAPVQIASDVKAVAGGYAFTLFIKQDGTLWGLGNNAVAQLGDGTTTLRRTPVQIATGVQQVAGGYTHTAFIKSDGTLWTTGENDLGQLADQTTTNRLSPVQVATNVVDVTAGNGFTLYVTAKGAPQIATQPLSQNIEAGATATFSVAASGGGTLTYQWRKNGAALTGATSAQLRIENAQAANAGNYDVVITNGAGSVTSAPATLALGSSRLSNLSVRANVGSGQVLIVGFATTGAKSVLVRGIGPGLNHLLPDIFAPADVYADPLLEVYNSGGTCIDQNDNWVSTVGPTFTAVGAFPLRDQSRDAALQCVLGGAHSVQLKGTGNGVCLIEVYDATRSYSPRLSNLSARNFVGTGADILIAGFAIDGSVPKEVLIRGVGIGLHDAFPAFFSTTDVLADPKLEIFNSANSKVGENDNWAESLAGYFNAVGAFPLNRGSRDAVLKVMLSPGTYSAQLSGVNSTTGIGLIEVYELQ